MAQFISNEILEKALNDSMRKEVEAALSVEIERAKSAIEEALKARIDNIALRLLTHYRIETREEEIVIRVDYNPREENNV